MSKAGCLIVLAGEQVDQTPSYDFTVSRQRLKLRSHSRQTIENRAQRFRLVVSLI
jgi:hypothetical protein